MGCPQSRLEDVRRVESSRDVDAPRGRADAPDAGHAKHGHDSKLIDSDSRDRDFAADRARLAKARKKRLAVAVEALASDAAVTAVPKDEAAVRLIARAVRDNPLFEGLPDETRAVLVSSMTRVEVKAGHDIITQGDENAEDFYVLESGAATVRVRVPPIQKNESEELKSGAENASPLNTHKTNVNSSVSLDDAGPIVATLKSGDAFGELALLYRCARAATVRASFDATLWALKRDVYVTVKRAHEESQRTFKKKLVNNVKALRALDDASRAKVADALKKATYDKGVCVVTKGDPGDRFFVVADGSLDVVDPDVVETRADRTQKQGKLLASLTAATLSASARLRRGTTCGKPR
jgi:CRP-like cAMP-binding protein